MKIILYELSVKIQFSLSEISTFGEAFVTTWKMIFNIYCTEFLFWFLTFSHFKFNSFPNSLSLFYVEKNFLIFRQLITHEKYNILINYEATIRKQNLVKQKVSCSWKNLQMLRSLVKAQFRNWKTLKFVHVQLFYSCSWYWLFI